MRPFLCILILMLCPVLTLPALAGPAEEIQAAVKLKIQGNLAAAIEKYEAAIQADRAAIAEDDGGLMKDLIEHYEKQAAGKDPAILFRLAEYLDMYGETDRAVEYYRQVAAGGGPQADEAKYRANSLKKEEQLYEQSVQDVVTTQAPAEPPRENPAGPVANGESDEEARPTDEEPDEATAMEAERQQKRGELETKIAEMEKEVAAAEDEMKEAKRDREGRGNVRYHRLKEDDADKDKYNNSFGRRYRAAKSEYEAKKAELDKMKEELNGLQ